MGAFARGSGPVIVKSDLPIHDPSADRSRAIVHAAPATSSRAGAAMLAILARPRQPGETIAESFGRKEAELAAVFANLDVTEARALRRRLDVARSDDAFVEAFSRLGVDRRIRLLAYLADAPRRAALRGATR